MTTKFIQEAQNILTTDQATEGSLLIEKKIYDELIEEVEKNLIPRTEAAHYIAPAAIPGSSIDIDLATPDTMKVRIIGEGAEAPLSAPAFTSTNLKPKKYATRIVTSTEMKEDGKWDLLAFSVRLAGKRLAENETNLIITALDGAGTTVAGGAAITIANLTTGMQGLEDNDYTPTTLIVGPEVLNDLRQIDTFVEVDKSGSTEMLQRGFLGTIFGMKVYRFSRNAAPSTTYSKYAYIWDKTEAYAIAEKRPITVENYVLPSHDISGAVITQRIVVSLLRSNAVAKITTA